MKYEKIEINDKIQEKCSEILNTNEEQLKKIFAASPKLQVYINYNYLTKKKILVISTGRINIFAMVPQFSFKTSQEILNN